MLISPLACCLFSNSSTATKAEVRTRHLWQSARPSCSPTAGIARRSSVPPTRYNSHLASPHLPLPFFYRELRAWPSVCRGGALLGKRQDACIRSTVLPTLDTQAGEGSGVVIGIWRTWLALIPRPHLQDPEITFPNRRIETSSLLCCGI